MGDVGLLAAFVVGALSISSPCVWFAHARRAFIALMGLHRVGIIRLLALDGMHR